MNQGNELSDEIVGADLLGSFKILDKFMYGGDSGKSRNVCHMNLYLGASYICLCMYVLISEWMSWLPEP